VTSGQLSLGKLRPSGCSDAPLVQAWVEKASQCSGGEIVLVTAAALQGVAAQFDG
jgi:hypothetical protein